MTAGDSSNGESHLFWSRGEALPFNIPSARDLVEVAGQPALFLVLWVNREAGRVDLMALRDQAYAVPDVPCAKLRPYQDEDQKELEST